MVDGEGAHLVPPPPEEEPGVDAPSEVVPHARLAGKVEEEHVKAEVADRHYHGDLVLNISKIGGKNITFF